MKAKPFFQKNHLWLTGGLFWAFVAFWFVWPPSNAAVENDFSREWYPWVLGVMTPATQWFSFPLVLLLLAAFLVWCGIAGCRCWTRASFAKCIWRALKWLFWLFPLLVTWGTVFWGAGYRRLPAEERLQLDTRPISSREESELRVLLLDTIKRNAATSERRDADIAISAIAVAMQNVVSQWNGRPLDLPWRVKTVPTGLLLRGSTSGVCSPFTLEALVDGGLPDTALVYTAAHELGHLAGFCSEAEASFLGYIAGLQAGDRFARYACALAAYMDLIRQLEGPGLKAALDALPMIARQDLQAIDNAYQRYQIEWISRIGWKTYNRYLKAQGIQEGIGNYSRGISLFSYAWRQGISGTSGMFR